VGSEGGSKKRGRGIGGSGDERKEKPGRRDMSIGTPLERRTEGEKIPMKKKKKSKYVGY